MTPEEFRTFGHQLVDWIADYRARIESLPVMSGAGPGEIKSGPLFGRHPAGRGGTAARTWSASHWAFARSTDSQELSASLLEFDLPVAVASIVRDRPKLAAAGSASPAAISVFPWQKA
jgi:hypothetical protein